MKQSEDCYFGLWKIVISFISFFFFFFCHFVDKENNRQMIEILVSWSPTSQLSHFMC